MNRSLNHWIVQNEIHSGIKHHNVGLESTNILLQLFWEIFFCETVKTDKLCLTCNSLNVNILFVELLYKINHIFDYAQALIYEKRQSG